MDAVLQRPKRCQRHLLKLKRNETDDFDERQQIESVMVEGLKEKNKISENESIVVKTMTGVY